MGALLPRPPRRRVRVVLQLECTVGAWGRRRAAWLVDDRLEACFYLSARPDLPGTEWLAECFRSERLVGAERAALLAGAPSTRASVGPTVCSCFGVGRQTIVDAKVEFDQIREQQTQTAIGAKAEFEKLR